MASESRSPRIEGPLMISKHFGGLFGVGSKPSWEACTASHTGGCDTKLYHSTNAMPVFIDVTRMQLGRNLSRP